MVMLLQGDIDANRSSNTQSPPMAGELPATRVQGMYRVPVVLRVQNEDAYRPSFVYIGPLNGWRGGVMEMEAVKKRYMGELLERNGTLANEQNKWVDMSDPILQNHLKYNQKAPIWYKHKEKPTFKYSATKLQSVEVKAHFKIPRFSINESTESLLRNPIAFEHCCPGIDNYFTSHAVTMSILLDPAEDVKLLEEAGVISNQLGFGEAVSELFKDITSDEIIVRNQNLLYKDLWMQVTDFCTPW
ncbi:uncharacterized protein LOC132314007 [Cornus florida]|uniref:uncharacterized protein LOC132314007 n=1 Tax=Cornus florida TaxID=4283 RepID=UPI002897BD8F|nr:uncharacterized protein LOC132314007 [Cornus florida]